MYCSNNLKIFLDKFLATLHIHELIVNPKEFNNSLGLKKQIIQGDDVISYLKNDNIDSLEFSVILNRNHFSEIIHCEVNGEYCRINEQINNVNSLLSSNNQPAWIIVTVYYACFFMGNLFSKLLGRTSINFSAEDIKKIFLHDKFPSLSSNIQDSIRSLNLGKNHNYLCLMERDEIDNQVKLRFIPAGDKPHQSVWLNFHSVIKNILSKNKHLEIGQFLLLQRIFDNSDKKFPLPSKLRNDWNYSNQKYFSEIGTAEAKKFLQLLKNRKSLESWVKDQTSIRSLSVNHSSPEDMVCSLAFLYTVFLDIFSKLIEVDIPSSKTRVRLPESKRVKKRKKNRYH